MRPRNPSSARSPSGLASPSEVNSATAAHDAAQAVPALLKKHEISDVDVHHFRESIYRHKAGPRLLRPVYNHQPLARAIGPLTPALGVPVATGARPDVQGTLGLYLAKGGGSDRLLGLTCRHVLIASDRLNVGHIYHGNRPARKVLHLGNKAYAKLVDWIKVEIGGHGIEAEIWNE